LSFKLSAMTISDERLEAFIDAYERENGERLSREEARDAAMRVLAFVELLSKRPAGRTADSGAGDLQSIPDLQTSRTLPQVRAEGDAPCPLPDAS
jgi:hypothetical protein